MNEDNVKKLIDFTLEVTNGCQFDCTGCTVDISTKKNKMDFKHSKYEFKFLFFGELNLLPHAKK